ncbi:MAG: hypothetical protein A07HR60_02824 [uncultured archaeon A07HR60]|nr:MAG: hypothetical protein A07HR60_02824 [uncultured archaeon A07HR60]
MGPSETDQSSEALLNRIGVLSTTGMVVLSVTDTNHTECVIEYFIS